MYTHIHVYYRPMFIDIAIFFHPFFQLVSISIQPGAPAGWPLTPMGNVIGEMERPARQHSAWLWAGQRSGRYELIGGLEHDFYFSMYWESHHPNWLIFFRGVQTTNQWIMVIPWWWKPVILCDSPWKTEDWKGLYNWPTRQFSWIALSHHMLWIWQFSSRGFRENDLGFHNILIGIWPTRHSIRCSSSNLGREENQKRPGSKSHELYEKYKKSKTYGEARRNLVVTVWF